MLGIISWNHMCVMVTLKRWILGLNHFFDRLSEFKVSTRSTINWLQLHCHKKAVESIVILQVTFTIMILVCFSSSVILIYYCHCYWFCCCCRGCVVDVVTVVVIMVTSIIIIVNVIDYVVVVVVVLLMLLMLLLSLW